VGRVMNGEQGGGGTQHQGVRTRCQLGVRARGGQVRGEVGVAGRGRGSGCLVTRRSASLGLFYSARRQVGHLGVADTFSIQLVLGP
jgi:hypothetical protein